MDDITLRAVGEDFPAYWIRLFEHKDEYKLTCEQIANLLNSDQGTDYGESKWRKDFAMFNRGREYERKIQYTGVVNRILCISDLHVPFQLPVDVFSKYAGLVDTLVINGDVVDAQAISKFPKAYRISPMEEIITARQYLIDLIELISPKKVIVTYGNHDIRFQNYLSKNLDTDILELMPQTSLDLIINDGFRHYDKRARTKIYYPPLTEVIEDVEIQYTGDWYTQVGGTIFCHPLAFSSGIMKTTDKAVSYFHKMGMRFDACVMSHTHRVGFYKEGNIAMYEQGACCDVNKMMYTDGRLTDPQKEGFIYFGQDKDGHIVDSSVVLVALN